MYAKRKALLAAGMIAGMAVLTGCTVNTKPAATPTPKPAQQQTAQPQTAQPSAQATISVSEAPDSDESPAPIPLTVEGEELCIAAVESVGERKADILTGMEIQEIVLIPEKEIEMAEYAAVDADVYLAGSDDVLSLPLRAITERDTVWWVNEERCTEIPAQIVLHDEMRAWVHLPEGMTVAIGEFKEGQRIKEVCP